MDCLEFFRLFFFSSCFELYFSLFGAPFAYEPATRRPYCSTPLGFPHSRLYLEIPRPMSAFKLHSIPKECPDGCRMEKTLSAFSLSPQHECRSSGVSICRLGILRGFVKPWPRIRVGVRLHAVSGKLNTHTFAFNMPY